jgi:hypothetical protein
LAGGVELQRGRIQTCRQRAAVTHPTSGQTSTSTQRSSRHDGTCSGMRRGDRQQTADWCRRGGGVQRCAAHCSRLRVTDLRLDECRVVQKGVRRCCACLCAHVRACVMMSTTHALECRLCNRLGCVHDDGVPEPPSSEHTHDVNDLECRRAATRSAVDALAL